MEMKRIDLSTNHFIPQTNFPKEGVRFGGLLACLLACLLLGKQLWSSFGIVNTPLCPTRLTLQTYSWDRRTQKGRASEPGILGNESIRVSTAYNRN